MNPAILPLLRNRHKTRRTWAIFVLLAVLAAPRLSVAQAAGEPDNLRSFPATVASLRVVAGKHFPTDVVAGALLGIAGGGAVHAFKS
jgi:hypothetical protein